MSQSAIQTLKDVNLLDKKGRAMPLTRISAEELQKKIDQYRDIRMQNALRESVNSIPDRQDLAAVISAVSASNAIDRILPSSFVYNRLYMNDPLISLATPVNELAGVYDQSLGLKQDRTLDSNKVMKILRYFHKLMPLIEIGCITFLPLAELNFEPTNGIPLFQSEDLFRSDVPEHIYDYVHNNAVVNKVVPHGDGLAVTKNLNDFTSRAIHIEFRNDSNVMGNLYFLQDMEFSKKIGENKYGFTLNQIDWNNLPSKEKFASWQEQSVNRTIINRLEHVRIQFSVARQLRASYVTESEFESTICGMNGSKDAGINEQSIRAVNFLNANAPDLNISSSADIARLKCNHSHLFERWQLTLLSLCDELKGVDGDDFEFRAKQLFAKEVQPQIDEIKAAHIKILGSIGGGVLSATFPIYLAVQSGVPLPLAIIWGYGLAVGKALPTIADYVTKHKGPAFIWNQLVRK